MNHYLGDGVLAVFGTPTPMTTTPSGGAAPPWKCNDCVRLEFGDDLQIGIGVNTGPVIAGSIGGGGHFEFTVIGDAVNVASRVERMTRQTGDAILITQATLDAMACAARLHHRPRRSRRSRQSQASSPPRRRCVPAL